MARPQNLRITYIGGGSRFVVTLLHGLACNAPVLKRLGTQIELMLLDPDTRRAGEMARYAQITARQTALPLTATVTDDRVEALRGARWVLLSAGMHEPIERARKLFESPNLQPYGEHAAGVAIEAAALWPYLRGLAADMKKQAPKALFSTLMNPTDVLAAAFQKAFGIPSVGICVEVGGLIGWLSYYLQVPEERIHIDHIGVNHVGWVSQWKIDGVKDAARFFWEKIPQRMNQDDWYAHPTFFVDLYRACGYMRSSPYHNWPFRTVWSEARQAQQERWAKACLPAGRTRSEHRQGALAEALAEGRMIPDFDPTRVHPEATPYTYPNTRHTLGALAVGLAGGKAGPVSLQCRNGRSNPWLPADAWIEAPTRIENGKFIIKKVKPLPEWLFNDTRTIAVGRIAIADWLAGRDPEGLTKGLLSQPLTGGLDDLLRVSAELSKVRDA